MPFWFVWFGRWMSKLALGVIGVLTAFEDAIELFALFSATRDLDRDFIILVPNLDMEKFVLLQWSEPVRVLEKERDEWLNHKDIQRSVIQILACVRLLLSDATQLEQRYGLDDASSSKHLIDPEEETPTMSGPIMDRFDQEFKALRFGIRQGDSSSVRNRAHWVIQDMRKFGSLVADVAHFTTKLREIVPPVASTQISHSALIIS